MQHKLVDVLVTTCGGIEEDFMKCMAHTYAGDWSLKGKDLREQVGAALGTGHWALGMLLLSRITMLT